MTKNLSSQKISFMDLEMLCWPDGKCPLGQSKYIIQVGICEIDSYDLKITRTANYYIRPNYKDFEVSEYCTNLTGITKELLLKEGRRFSDVMNTIRNEFSPRGKVSYAWGSDNDAIIEQCLKDNIENPWGNTGIWDLGVIFRSNYSIKKKLTLANALKYLHLTFEGKPHSAVTDAINLGRLHIEMIRKIRG